MPKTNTWMMALKEYNQGGAWCVYKKGTPQYNEVRKIQDRLKRGEPPTPDREESELIKSLSKSERQKLQLAYERAAALYGFDTKTVSFSDWLINLRKIQNIPR